ncbi:MAG: putative MPP superfamily phosphohydrolase [Kiritimatiellia bacterium]|jgi:uncharacterized protein
MPIPINRRTFLGSAALGAVGVLGYTFRIGPHHLQMTHRPMPLANLPPRWHGKRLIHISDFHIGPSVDDGYLKSVFGKIASLEPDVICFTGDFMTCHGGEEIVHALEVTRHLKPARIATLAIPGNHDYGFAWRQKEVADELVDGLDQQDVFHVLRNQRLDIDGIDFYGLDDLWAQAFNNQILREDNQQPSIALSHNPDTADLPGWANYQGWILAGHTHGGQCKPPFLPPPLVPVKNQAYTRGVFDLAPGRSMHISAGLGHLLKVRFNVRPEITVFELTEADQLS